MAGRDDRGDVEMGNFEISTEVPAPPNVLEQARLGNLDLFRTELESGNHPLDFKAGGSQFFNRTPLHLAAMEGHENIVEFILSRPEILKEVVNAKDDFGYTPLHLAVRHAHESVVRLLTTSSLVLPDRFLTVTSESDDVLENRGGWTPLHFAAGMKSKGVWSSDKRIAIAKLLLQQPCQAESTYDPVNISARSWRNLTPLDLARQNKFRHLEEFLEASDLNWLLQERERCAISLNAILVGAALVVAATFATWMQPPGGIPAPHSAASGVSATSGAPTPSPSASSSSTALDRRLNFSFFSGVAVAFWFSVTSLICGILATFSNSKMTLQHDLLVMRMSLRCARGFLLVALLYLIVAFGAAGERKFFKSTKSDMIAYVATFGINIVVLFIVGWRGSY